MDRSQCIVIRNDQILMVTHSKDNRQWLCLPGGGVEDNESPEEAALRELYEECLVKGQLIKQTSNYRDPYTYKFTYTYLVDIGDQNPILGEDPELMLNPILINVGWYKLDEICERDRVFLWAAGLISIKQFAQEVSSWGDDISYPSSKNLPG